MASADELRATIASGRDKLREAINGASGKWEMGVEDGDEANWGSRKVAEHCIGSETYFSKMIADVMLSKAPESGDASFETPADAITGLEALTASTDKIIRYVEDRDLAKTAPMPDGTPFSKDIEGVLAIMGWHLDNHANQIVEA